MLANAAISVMLTANIWKRAQIFVFQLSGIILNHLPFKSKTV